MIEYYAFLRGINISGKNKIPMSILKINAESLGFTDVKTYFNSGNMAFSSDLEDMVNLTNQIETMIYREFDLNIPVFVVEKNELTDIIQHAPEWWGSGSKDIYDNLIFILPDTTFTDVLNEVGEPSTDIEQIMNYKNVVFWSFKLKGYQKANWWQKTATADIGKRLTIRTANTVRKVVGF